MKQNNKFDAIIIGAGLSGMLISIILAQYGKKIALIDQNDINQIKTRINDGRVSAISFVATNILKKFGIWQNVSNYASPINEIKVFDNDSPLSLEFDKQSHPLGYMLENHIQLNNLLNILNSEKNISLFFKTKYEDFTVNNDEVTVKLPSEELKANILIASDGKNSSIREKLSIKPTKNDYQQIALVFNIEHELPHNNTAYEIFTSQAPIAILPLVSSNQSSIVFQSNIKAENFFRNLKKQELESLISNHLNKYVGKIKIISEIFYYPLSLIYSNNYYQNRIVFVGDSIHSIHPLAGQGFNQTILDIESLTKLMRFENDIGQEHILKTYQKSRIFDNNLMIQSTDKINSIFTSKNPFISFGRKISLSLINKSKITKKHLMLYAMGFRY